jgi:general secretion pathway protein A
MYNEYFGFKEAPFSIAPDPRYLYMTPQHREALAHLVYGLNSEGGCILLTGEVGTGKTTVCRCLLEQIPEHAHIALVLNPKVSAIELLETICDELKIDYPLVGNTVKTYIDRINNFLIEANARNEKTVLIIDEAQNLDSTVLEQLRLLTNLETNQRKLLQIIILGQPELLDILARPEMRQLAQRITARFHLNALAPDEIKAYIAHRLAVAGQNVQLFPEATLRRLFRLSNGIPRLINILCDRALLGSYVQNQHLVDTHTLNTAAKEVFGELKNVETRMQRRPWAWILSALVLVAGAAAFGWWASVSKHDDQPAIETTTEATAENAGNTDENIDAVVTDEQNTTGNSQPAAEVLSVTDDNMGSVTDTSESLTAQLEKPVITREPQQAADTMLADTDALQAWIATAPASSKIDAYRALFTLWNRQYDESRHPSACNYASSEGLDCMHKQGNLNSIKRINRPAVLHVFNNDGRDAYVTLARLENNQAVVLTGDQEQQVSIDDLESHWYGEYSLLWQKPPYYAKPLLQGHKGAVVQWLDQQLARLLPAGNATIRDVYTREMSDQVASFQRSAGLQPDGIAGPMTFIHLNTALGHPVPVLVTPSAGNE